MIIHRLCLGTWFPRTSIHLKEVFHFLQSKEGIRGLDTKKLKKLHDNLGVTGFKLHEELTADFFRAFFPGGQFLMTEEGVLLIRTENAIESLGHEFAKARDFLLEFYSQKLGPALNYLFSLGAPIPRNLADIRTVLPFIAVISGAKEDEIQGMYDSIMEKQTSVVEQHDVEIHRSRSLTVIHVKNGTADIAKLEKIIEHDVFFREFEFQLEEYLIRHRTYWDEISSIRDSRTLRYKDFSNIRRRLLELRRSITYVEARLLQMHEILKERRNTTPKEEKDILENFGLNRFTPLESAQAYTKHLWEMTLQYLDGTVSLLHTLYEENTQRELAIIKMTTFAAAITGFFGMNIAFPWDSEWITIKYDSYAIAFVVITGSVLFYFILKFAVMNRRFSMGGNENHLKKQK